MRPKLPGPSIYTSLSYHPQLNDMSSASGINGIILSLQSERLPLSTTFSASSASFFSFSRTDVATTNRVGLPALWVYDYLQTLPMEVQAIWTRKPTLTAIIFLTSRYSMLLYIMTGIYTNIPETTHFTWRLVNSKPPFKCRIIILRTAVVPPGDSLARFARLLALCQLAVSLRLIR